MVRRTTASLTSVLLGLLFAALVLGLPAKAQGPITVCPVGCDYATIGQGMAAAGAGDTVLVYAGVYTEQVGLKSGVALVAPDGPQSTTVTYPFGPIVQAVDVVSASLEGLTIRGTQPMTNAVGVQLTGGQLVISGCIVGPMQAATDLSLVGLNAHSVNLTVTQTAFTNLHGGGGGEHPGSTTGVHASGGAVSLVGNQFDELWSTFSPYNPVVRAIHTTGMIAATITDNTITRLNLRWDSAVAEAPEASAQPRPSRLDAIGIDSDHDRAVLLADNVIAVLTGHTNDGNAVGIRVSHGHDVTIVGNCISDLAGSYSSQRAHRLTTVGIAVDQTSSVSATGNVIGPLVAVDDGLGLYFPDGGGVAGIYLHVVTSSLVADNVIWSLVGGDGKQSDLWSWPSGSGGDAFGVYVERSTARVQNNTLWGLRGGLCPDLTCEAWCPRHGYSAGLNVTDGSDVLALNNAIVSATLGVTATAAPAPVLGYNAFWETQADYGGLAVPGANDLHVDPQFAHPAEGDFRLLPFSPLIDAGTNLLLLDEDFQGETRPWDGDGDGTARVDIGADEYYPWLIRRHIFPVVFRAG